MEILKVIEAVALALGSSFLGWKFGEFLRNKRVAAKAEAKVEIKNVEADLAKLEDTYYNREHKVCSVCERLVARFESIGSRVICHNCKTEGK